MNVKELDAKLKLVDRTPTYSLRLDNESCPEFSVSVIAVPAERVPRGWRDALRVLFGRYNADTPKVRRRASLTLTGTDIILRDAYQGESATAMQAALYQTHHLIKDMEAK